MSLIVIYSSSNPEKKENIIINKLSTLFNNFKANLLPENKIKIFMERTVSLCKGLLNF